MEDFIVYFDDEQGTERSHVVTATYAKMVDGHLTFMGRKWPRDTVVASYAPGAWKRFGAKDRCLQQSG